MNNVLYVIFNRYAVGEAATVAAFFNKESAVAKMQQLDAMIRESEAQLMVESKLVDTIEAARTIAAFDTSDYALKEIQIS